MKPTNILRYTAISILCMAFATTASASSWRIHHNAKQLPDFTDINAACASDLVLDGDTLYLDPGCLLTTEQNVTKQLTIIGCGYEGVTQPYAFATISGVLYLKAANIKVMSAIMSNTVSIQASDITLERCRIRNGVNRGGTCPNATIRQCYVSKSTGTAIDGSSNWTVENCIVNAYSTYAVGIGSVSNSIIRNNLIISNQTGKYYTLSASSSSVTNNIIINTAYADHAFEGDATQLTNNVISQNIAGEYNRVNVLTLDSIYTGNIQSYTLKEDSPAKGYGKDETDCGIFGGMHPYVKGGRPFGHPYYTELKVASMPDENKKLKITLKTKMQDE